MAKKTGKKSEPVSTPEPEIVDGFVTRESDEPVSSSRSSSRLVIYTSAEGGVDWQKTNPEMKEKVISVITEDADMLETLAANPILQEEALESQGWMPEDAGVVLDVLAKVEGMLASKLIPKLLGQRMEMSTATMAFNIDKEEHERQDPLGAALMNQFIPIDPRWKNITLFLAAHSACVMRNVREAITLQMQKDGDLKVTTAKPNGHAAEESNG